jgi:hypothetical protein
MPSAITLREHSERLRAGVDRFITKLAERQDGGDLRRYLHRRCRAGGGGRGRLCPGEERRRGGGGGVPRTAVRSTGPLYRPLCSRVGPSVDVGRKLFLRVDGGGPVLDLPLDSQAARRRLVSVTFPPARPGIYKTDLVTEHGQMLAVGPSLRVLSSEAPVITRVVPRASFPVNGRYDFEIVGENFSPHATRVSASPPPPAHPPQATPVCSYPRPPIIPGADYAPRPDRPHPRVPSGPRAGARAPVRRRCHRRCHSVVP